MSFAIAAVAISAAGLGLAGYEMANQPGTPNLTADSQQMAVTQATELPEINQLQAEAELGGSALMPGYTEGGDATQIRSTLQGQINQLKNQKTPAAQQKIQQLQGQLNNLPASGTVYYGPGGNVVPQSQAVANFNGMSQADIQGQIMNQLAAGQLATEQQYSPQFIQQALQEEQQANPQGVAARSDLANDIQQQIANPPSSPVANALQGQVSQQVAAGSGLTPEEQALLDQSVNGANVPGNFSNDLTTGFAGQQRGEQNAAAGEQLLSSGETPADIQYRATQQNIANLGNFYSGATPQSQFKSLTGAQQGATPIGQAPQMSGYNLNAPLQGAEQGVTGFEQQLSQANPWMSGLTAALGTAKVAGAAGL